MPCHVLQRTSTMSIMLCLLLRDRAALRGCGSLCERQRGGGKARLDTSRPPDDDDDAWSSDLARQILSTDIHVFRIYRPWTWQPLCGVFGTGGYQCVTGRQRERESVCVCEREAEGKGLDKASKRSWTDGLGRLRGLEEVWERGSIS